MSFLFPLLWLGALAVAVPVWLHLRHRDESNLIEFSAMRFLDDQPLARSRPMRPRDWPLLLLRLLALLALIAAFAWPYEDDEATVTIDESRVYILDNTLSHQADDRFAEARQQLADELADGQLSTQIAVIELGSLPRVVVPFGESPQAAADTVRQLAASDQRGPYLDAFRMAADLLQTALGARRRIVLLGDSQANQWQEAMASQPFLDGIELELPEVRDPQRPNVSLAAPQIQRFSNDGNDRVECVVRLERHGGCRRVTVVFAAAGAEVARREVEFRETDRERETLSVYVDWESPADQWLLGQVSLEFAESETDQNALATDDLVSFSLPPRKPGRVALLVDSPFVLSALSPQVLGHRWVAEPVPVGEYPLAEEQPADVVVLESHRLTSGVVRDGLRDTLNAGGGVILLVDRASPIVAGFLKELGIEMQPDGRRESGQATFRYAFLEHPIFELFRNPDTGDLSAISVLRHRRLRVAQSLPLAFAANGDPLMFEVTGARGRMLLFAFHFDREDTNWPVHPTFIPFLDKCLTHVRAEPPVESNYEPGESVVWEPLFTQDIAQIFGSFRPAAGESTDAAGGGNGVLTGTGDPTDTVAIPVRDGQARFRLPPRAGQYLIQFQPDGPIQAVLNVNPASLESDLTFAAEPQAIAGWTSESEESSADAEAADEQIELSELEILQQRWWWRLLLAALAAMLLETVWVALKSPPE